MDDAPQYNAAHLRAAVKLFLPPGGVVELRALGVERGGTCSGYFDDPELLIEAACALSGRAEGIYCTLNPVKRELMARAYNRARPFSRYTTSDDDVEERRWMVIDVDPVRPRGISATDEEQASALDRAGTIRRFVGTHIGRQPDYVASSGNGCHLGYRYRRPNNPEAKENLQTFLRALSVRFSDEMAHVDATLFNAARITRFYGTMARKGDATADRPHRISRFIELAGTATAGEQKC